MKRRNQRNKRRRKNQAMKKIFLLAAAVAAVYFYREWDQADPSVKEDTISAELPEKEAVLEETENEEKPLFPFFEKEAEAPVVDLSLVKSSHAILIDLAEDKVIADKKSSEKIYPASLTKMMTILIGIEKMPNLDKEIVMSEKFFENLIEMDASLAGFQIGEVVTFRDVLLGAMLPSGAESCLAIASLIAGSEEAFVEVMNQKAQEIGMENTHFANTTGLHDPKNYSSAEDLALLLEYALQNEEFASIFTTKDYTTAPTNLSPEGVHLESALFKYLNLFPNLAPLLEGGKTGFTEEAGLCLASMAEIDGKHYILITAGAPYDEEKWDPVHVEDAALVYLQLQTKNKENAGL